MVATSFRSSADVDPRPANPWLAFQIKEVDWTLAPLARLFCALEQAVFNNCTKQHAPNTVSPEKGARTAGATRGANLKERQFDCSGGGVAKEALSYASLQYEASHYAFPHVLMSNASWFGIDGLDFFVFISFFSERRGGVFLEVGNYDGLDNSNTLFFEEYAYLGWTGVLFEPTSCADKYQKNRNVPTLRGGAVQEGGVV